MNDRVGEDLVGTGVQFNSYNGQPSSMGQADGYVLAQRQSSSVLIPESLVLSSG